MVENLHSLHAGAGWSSILLIFGPPADKEKLPARLATALTVLFLIIAGSPLADVNTNVASADSNPYATAGSIFVITNNAAAAFTLTGPAAYSGSGTTWTQTDAPVGDYLITYNSISGYDTPASETLALGSGGTITFTGAYTASVGTIVVNTNNATATFTLTGPATYSGSGTGWTQNNAPVGTYTITYGTIPGYDTPPSHDHTLLSGDTIVCTGLYNKTVYTLTSHASADAYISEWNPSAKYGNETNATIRSFFWGTNKNGRSLIMFNISSIPPGSTIISATLKLITSDVPAATRNYKINKVETAWNELSVTWNSKPAVASSPTSSAYTPSSPGWMEWDVTPDMQAFVNGDPNYANYGWQISDANENSPSEYKTTFHTKESTSATKRPQLVIQYAS